MPYEDSFLLVGGRHLFYTEVFIENNEIYKFELDAAAPKTMSTELRSDGTLYVHNPPTEYNGSWKKLPQKTRTPRYSGEDDRRGEDRSTVKNISASPSNVAVAH